MQDKTLPGMNALDAICSSRLNNCSSGMLGLREIWEKKTFDDLEHSTGGIVWVHEKELLFRARSRRLESVGPFYTSCALPNFHYQYVSRLAQTLAVNSG